MVEASISKPVVRKLMPASGLFGKSISNGLIHLSADAEKPRIKVTAENAIVPQSICTSANGVSVE